MKMKTAVSRDLLRALRKVELFGALSGPDLARFAEAGQVADLGPGACLFSPDDPADRIHLILDGVIEITRVTRDHDEPVPVAYLTAGELIGDMALLTRASRRSGARVPESARVWTLTSAVFEELAAQVPGFGMSVARVFAYRLEDFIKHMRRQQARRKELSGHLRYFDMPTVVQTLVSSAQTGILTITDGAGESYAEVLLIDGEIERARCAQLHGEEAFYEIFVGPEDGGFHFRTVAVPDADATSTTPVAPTSMNLLMEAMRRLDELTEAASGLPQAESPLEATVEPNDIQWEDDATRETAEKVVFELRSPRPIKELHRQVPCSTYELYKVAAALHASEQIV